MRTLLWFALMLFSTLLTAQYKLPSELVDNINKRIEYGLNTSIAIGVVDKDGTHYFNIGHTKTDGPSVNEHSIYEIGSISKTFTAILLADQVIKGAMSLDDPISMYLPKDVTVPTYDGENITLGHLSDHTSSLPRMPGNFDPADPNNPYADYSADLLMTFLSEVTLSRPIGSQYEYSNLAQGLLGYILERKSGKSYEQLMYEVITEPLNMTETKLVFDDQMRRNLAVGHSGNQEVSNWDLGVLVGAGGIRSSVYDMMKYISANMNNDTNSLSKAMKMTHDVRHDKAGNSRVGLAWHIEIDHNSNQPFIGHSGATGGYRAFSAFHKGLNRGVVVLSNSDASIDDIGRYLMGASTKLAAPKRNAAARLRSWIDDEGIDQAMIKYKELKEDQKLSDQYNFDEDDLNGLGYYYMGRDQLDKAIAVFELNISEHPESFNPYDSYAEALMNKSIANYKKSIELNPTNQNGYDMLAKMGHPIKQDVKEINPEILKGLVGNYQLAPSFFIAITTTDDRLFAQATGQGRFELFSTSDIEYFLKIVDAKVIFDVDDKGYAKKLTLYQNGQEIPGKRVE